MNNTEALREIQAALDGYEAALKARQHGGMAQHAAFQKIQAAMSYLAAQQPAASGEPAAHFSPVTVLPDGSAFATASFPLPKDHWLYAPRGEWDNERDEYAECPAPILTHANRDAVQAAVRYAVRGATMCGQDADFDPDALVLNAIYALCGPFGADTAQPAPAPDVALRTAVRLVLDATPDQLPMALDALRDHAATAQPAPARVPLTDDPGAIEYIAEKLAADKGVRWGNLGTADRNFWRDAARKARAATAAPSDQSNPQR